MSIDIFVSLCVRLVMRFFGIPCRVVTNFDSAHDTNANLTIDLYYDDSGLREKESRDSVWWEDHDINFCLICNETSSDLYSEADKPVSFGRCRQHTHAKAQKCYLISPWTCRFMLLMWKVKLLTAACSD